ncbi:MAG: hypothetical protein KAY37_08860, partial [Phycisphaerae bacterium]|nr:hypothetical protein [Phycisphaerae bacterium]
DQVPALEDLAARLETPDGITDPDALRAWLEEAEGLTQLPAFSRFVLLSRGVPAGRILSRRRSEAWDRPGRTLDRLTRRAELPAFWELLELQQQLTAAYQNWSEAGGTEFAEDAERQAVEASFQITAALLARALGVDQQDLSGRGRPVPYNDSPEAWDALASQLDRQVLRTWAALANILAAGTPLEQPAEPKALARAQELWADVRKVNPDVWRALDDSASGWLPRLSTADRQVEPGMLPLARAFNSNLRSRRQSYEDTIRGLLAGPTPEANELFRNIQWAKAAGLGVPVNPLTVAELEQALGERQLVYLFVEIMGLAPAEPGQDPTYCGIAVYRKLYQERQAGVAYDDEYLSKVIPPQASPSKVVATALAAPGPPLRENSRIQKDARIIIAPDGPLSADWFEYEWRTLLQPTEWGIKPSWIVYTPSAAMLNSAEWKLDAILRGWYRSALHAGSVLPTVSSPPQALSQRGSGPPLESRATRIYVVGLGEEELGDENRLNDFMAAKRGRQMAVLPLWVRE